MMKTINQVATYFGLLTQLVQKLRYEWATGSLLICAELFETWLALTEVKYHDNL